MPDKEDYKELLDQNLSEEDKSQLEEVSQETQAETVSNDQSPGDTVNTKTSDIRDSNKPEAGQEATENTASQEDTIKEAGETLQEHGVEPDKDKEIDPPDNDKNTPEPEVKPDPTQEQEAPAAETVQESRLSNYPANEQGAEQGGQEQTQTQDNTMGDDSIGDDEGR